jgi:hypothetical protein
MASFVDAIHFDTLYSSLSTRGFTYSDASKERLKTLIAAQVRGDDGGTTSIPSDIGGLFKRIGITLVQCCQFLFSFFSDKPIDASISPLEGTTAASQLSMLNQGMMGLHRALKADPEFAPIAELVTGQGYSSRGVPENMPGSVYNQIKASIENLTPTLVARGPNLNFAAQGQQFPVSDVSAPSAPLAPRTPALTPQPFALN